MALSGKQNCHAPLLKTEDLMYFDVKINVIAKGRYAHSD